jgi:flagellar basal-body rod protein FlgF
MSYGMYLAGSSLAASMYRMDVAANNLANIQTVGFKPDLPTTRFRPAAREEDGLAFLPSNAMLEKLGGGVRVGPTRVNQRQGPLETTGQALDVAIQGAGFFVVKDGAGSGPETFRFTRDGRLTLDRQSRLVQTGTGKPVLDENDRPISLDSSATITIEPSGLVRQNGQIAGKLALVNISRPDELRKAGHNMFMAPPELMARRSTADGTLVQGAVERAAVDPVRATLDVMGAERAASSASRLIAMYDELMQKAATQFARMG